MAFNVVEGGLGVTFPRWLRVRQRFDATEVADVRAAVAAEMHKLDGGIQPGLRIAVGVGSRGIARIADITRAVVDELKARRAEPYIVPAMGSHARATAEGQAEMLAGYGITPQTMGVPVHARMEVRHLGDTPHGFPVYFSQAALEADAVLPVNRVKVHTDFHGPVESGITKMLVIGLGKHKGAAAAHQRGSGRFPETLPEARRVVMEHVRVLGGLAIIENSFDRVAHLEVIPGPDIDRREPELLDMSRRLMPHLPFDRLDVLVVDYMGKNISGAGLDPNITGRYFVRHIPNQDRLNPLRIVVLRLTELTHGNAAGLGVADVTTKALIDDVDYQAFWVNTIASTELPAGATPVWMPSDRDAIALALLTCHRSDPAQARLVRIPSTLEVHELWVSEMLWQADGAGQPNLEAISDPQEMAFTSDGQLVDLPLPRRLHGRLAWT